MLPGYLEVYSEEEAEVLSIANIAHTFGWTLDYIRSLNEDDRDLIEAFLSGLNRAEKDRINSARNRK